MLAKSTVWNLIPSAVSWGPEWPHYIPRALLTDLLMWITEGMDLLSDLSYSLSGPLTPSHLPHFWH